MPKKSGKQKLDRRTKAYRQAVANQEHQAYQEAVHSISLKERIQTLETSLAEQLRRVAELSSKCDDLTQENTWYKQNAENGSFAVRDLAYSLRKCKFN